MIRFAKPVLTEVRKEELSITCYMCDMYTWRKAKHIHKRQTHPLWREMMLRKDYDYKGSVEKKSLVVSLKGLDAKTNWLAVSRKS
jgi:hypothetical protein